MVRFIFKPLSAVLAALLFIITQAEAGGGSKDLDAYGPAWVGFYIGAHAGLAFTDTEFKKGRSSDEDDDTDFIGGFQVGYNWLSDSMVYGLEADWTFLNGDVGTIRGRVGQMMGNKLFYATAGVAFIDDSDIDTTGFVIGGGVEFDLNHRWQNVTAGVEGLYYDFEDDSSSNSKKDFDVESNSFVLRARLNYHLGADLRPLK